MDVIHQGGSTQDTKIPLYENAEWAKGYDVVIHDECFAGVKDLEWVKRILKPHQDGVPAVNLHCAMHCYRTGTDDWFKYCGIQSASHGPQAPIAITYSDKEHPAVKGLPEWTTINEELYNNIKVFETARPLSRGKQELTVAPPLSSIEVPAEFTKPLKAAKDNAHPGKWVIKDKDGKLVKDKDGKVIALDGVKQTVEFVVTWTNEYGPNKTRVFCTTLGHNNDTVGDARYLDLVTRGALWACDKLNDAYLKPAPAPAAK